MIKGTIRAIIKKEGGHYKLVSKETGRNLGTASTKEGIKKRERQVEYFKHLKGYLKGGK